MRPLIACAFVLLGTSGHAETIFVRSGQHESFSRLVLSIPVGGAWRLGRSGNGYELSLDEGEHEFDVSEVFERISTNRITSLGQQSGQLSIDLACDCHADAFLWRSDRLVIDIVDGPAPLGSEFEAALSNDEQVAPAVPRVMLPIVTEAASTQVRAPLIAGTFEVDPPSDTRVAEAERAIIESLARAASQGVFAMPSRPLPFVADQLTEDGVVSEASALPVLTPVTDPMDGMPSELSEPGSASGPGLVLRTSIERADDGQPGDPGADGRCIENTQVSLQDWGDDRDYSIQLADRRRALTSEFDAYPDGAIEDMARTFLYFGFGQEARQALSLDGQRSRERLILEAMARIVDGLPPSSAILNDQLDCDGFVALWAGLSVGSIADLSEDGRNAAVMAFRLLPDSLRGHLGAKLAQLFLDAGDAETADIVMTAIRSTEPDLSFEADLTSAEVAGEIDGPQAVINDLGDMAESDTRMTPEALARLIELQLAEAQTVAPSLLELAAAMRFEAGDSEAATRLALAEISAHEIADDFETALSIALDSETPITNMQRGVALNEVHLAMAERLDEAAFLTTAFGQTPQELDPGVQNVMAARLIHMGFPERALELLQGPAVQDEMSERRYLRAEAAAAMNDLDGVEFALAGLSDRRANTIRSQAFAATGDYQSALAQDLLAEDSLPDAAEAWRAGAWTILETGDDQLLQDASRAILAENDDQAEISTLAQRMTLLDQAEATRSLTEELLGRFSIAPSE